MIILITMYEKCERTGVQKLVVSHGVDEMDRNVCLPSEHPTALGGVYDEDLMEYVLRDPAPSPVNPERSKPRVDWFSAEYGDGAGPGM